MRRFRSPRLESASSAPYSTRTVGTPNSIDRQIFIEQDGYIVSSLHDIPLLAQQAPETFNMVVKCPKWTNATMGLAIREPFQPIKPSLDRKGRPQYVRNCFPHHGYMWNYGSLPQLDIRPVDQTCDDPSSPALDGGLAPLGVCEIGEQVAYTGQVKQVKILGAIALFERGAMNWKIIAIDVLDPSSPKMNDIGDVDKYFPGLLRATVEWFRIYQMPEGMSENVVASSDEAKGREDILGIIAGYHNSWRRMITLQAHVDGVALHNVTIRNSPGFVRKDDPIYTSILGAGSNSSLLPTFSIEAPSVSKSFHITDHI